jgi:hypothetical protein
MYKSIKYLFLFLLIIFIFFIINYSIEPFSNKYYSDFDVDINLKEENNNKNFSCNDFYKDNSFCSNDDNKCSCNFQKDNLRYLFDSPDTCCKKLCRKYSPEKCLNTTPFLTEKYYCRNGDKCNESKGTILNSRIASNSCGTDSLNNQLLLPYASYDECMKTMDVCDKYNVKDRSQNINKQECLKDVNCGYCSNNTGGGKCISGTASGPNDMQQYFYCTPGSVSKTYSYTYGDHMIFLLQS